MSAAGLPRTCARRRPALRNRAIAQKLCISESTVKSHLKSLFAKLDATSRAEAISLAARRGLIRF